jgi:alanyl-tRNA synthetase
MSEVVTREQALKELKDLRELVEEKIQRKHEELQAQVGEKRQLEEQVQSLKKENSLLQKRMSEASSSKAEQLFSELVKPIIEREVAKLSLGSAQIGGSSEGSLTGTMDHLVAEIKMREKKYEFDTKNPTDQLLAVMVKEFPQSKVRMKELKEALLEYGYKEACNDVNGLLAQLISDGLVLEEHQDATHKIYRLPGKVSFVEAK